MNWTTVLNCLVLLIALTAIGTSGLPKQSDSNQASGSATDDLWKAVAAGDVHGTRMAVSKGADLKEKRKVYNTKGTPLNAAALLGYADVAFSLITLGADINAKEDNWLGTPLHRAARMGNLDVVRVLIAAGADVNNNGDYMKRTPIFLAAEDERTNVAKTLIYAGANVKATKDDGQTPLHWAARFDSLYTAVLLVNHGADVNARDQNGKTPLTTAMEFNRTEMANYLKSVGGVL